jgi:hypothetical protein
MQKQSMRLFYSMADFCRDTHIVSPDSVYFPQFAFCLTWWAG